MRNIILIPVILMTLSCGLLLDELENVYPEDITISGFGTLRYEKTIYDNHSVGSMFLDGNLLWFHSSKDFGNKTYINSYDVISDTNKKHFSVDSLDQGPLLSDDYIISIINPLSFEEPFFMRLINQNNWEITDRELPVAEGGKITSSGSTLYLHDYYASPYKYYRSVDYGINWVQIDESTYEENVPANNSDSLYIDNLGNQYRIIDESSSSTKTYLEVSIDGVNWFRSDLGTNYGLDIVFYGEYVYISCNWYYDSHLAFIPGPHTGGGIQVFKWYY